MLFSWLSNRKKSAVFEWIAGVFLIVSVGLPGGWVLCHGEDGHLDLETESFGHCHDLYEKELSMPVSDFYAGCHDMVIQETHACKLPRPVDLLRLVKGAASSLFTTAPFFCHKIPADPDTFASFHIRDIPHYNAPQFIRTVVLLV